MRKLISTLTRQEYSFYRLEEFADNGEPLEVEIEGIEDARVRSGEHLTQRFASFLPFQSFDPELSMGEGNTPLLNATPDLRNFTGIKVLVFVPPYTSVEKVIIPVYIRFA